MKIAITGGTGFVGRNIARQLARTGHSLVLVAGGPVFWLFPPVFIHQVMLPMLQAIGAIGVLL